MNAEKSTWQFETFTIDLMTGIFAYACAVIWLSSFFLTDVTPFFHVSGYSQNILILAFVLLTAVFVLLSAVFADHLFSGKRMTVLAVSLIASLVLYEATFFSVVNVVFAALLAASLLQTLHGFLSRYTQVSFYVGLAAVACGAGIAIMSYLTPHASFVLIQVLPFIAVLIMLAVARPKDDSPFVTKEESKSRYTYSASSMATMIMDGLFVGMGLFLIGQMGSFPSSARFPIVAALIALVGIVDIVDFGHSKISEKLMLQSYSVRIAPFLLMLPLASGIGIDLCTYALLFFMMFNVLMIVCATTERVRFNQLSAAYAFGQTLFLVFVGLGIGWLLGHTALQFQDSLYIKAAVFYVPLFVIIVFNSFLFEDNFPVESEIELEEVVDPAVSARPWRQAIEYVEETYSLSPRQSEVFELLARGRNCEYIKDEFCISKATAKAHIYSIYRKVDVHSQQELINLVESIVENQRPSASVSKDARSGHRS